MGTIIVFGSSLFVSFVLICLKAIELKFQKRNFILRILGLLDGKVAKFTEAVKFRTLQIIQSVRYLVLVHSKSVAQEKLTKIQNRIISEYQTREQKLMGKRDINSSGSVSFYLKKIATEKGAGRIEEDLIH
jgi:hypothetical protein